MDGKAIIESVKTMSKGLKVLIQLLDERPLELEDLTPSEQRILDSKRDVDEAILLVAHQSFTRYMSDRQLQLEDAMPRAPVGAIPSKNYQREDGSWMVGLCRAPAGYSVGYEAVGANYAVVK